MQSNVGRVGHTPIVGRLEVCPFDDAHSHPAERMQLHIAKCAKQHPHVKVVRCKFNSSHVMKPGKLADHERYCPDRASVEIMLTSGAGVASESMLKNGPPVGQEWPDNDWETSESTNTSVHAAIEDRAKNDATIMRCRSHIGMSKAMKKKVRETNAQEYLIECAKRGMDVDPEAMRCYEHRLAVPEELLKRAQNARKVPMEAPEEKEAVNGNTETDLVQKMQTACKIKESDEGNAVAIEHGAAEQAVMEPPRTDKAIPPNAWNNKLRFK